MILYHTFSRIAEGYDETYCSDGLARKTIESEILPLCKLDEPINGFETVSAHAYTYKVIDAIERKAIFGVASIFNDGRRSKKYHHALILYEDYDRILWNPMELLTNNRLNIQLVDEKMPLESLTDEQENALLNAVLSTIDHQGRLYIWFPFEDSLENYSNVACFYFLKMMQKIPQFVREIIGFRSFSTTLQRSRHINLIAMQPSTEALIANLNENEGALQFYPDGSYMVHGLFKSETEVSQFFAMPWERMTKRINDLYINCEKNCNLYFKNEPIRHLKNIAWINKNLILSSSDKWEYDDVLFSLEALVLYGEVDIVKKRHKDLLMKLFGHLHRNLLDAISILDIITTYGDLCFKVERFQKNLEFLLKRMSSFDRDRVGAFLLELARTDNTQKYVYQMIFSSENWCLFETFLEYLRKNRLMEDECDRIIDELMMSFSKITNFQITKTESKTFVVLFSDICKDIYDLKHLVLLLEKWRLYLGAHSNKAIYSEIEKVFLRRINELFQNNEIIIEQYDLIERAAYLIEDALDFNSYENLNIKAILKVIEQSRTIEYNYFSGFDAYMSFSDFSKSVKFIRLAFENKTIWQLSYDELLVYLMTTYDYATKSFSLISTFKAFIEGYKITNDHDCREQMKNTIRRLEKIGNNQKKIGDAFQRDSKLFTSKSKWFRKIILKNRPKQGVKWQRIVIVLIIIILIALYILLLFYIFNTLIGG